MLRPLESIALKLIALKLIAIDSLQIFPADLVAATARGVKHAARRLERGRIAQTVRR